MALSDERRVLHDLAALLGVVAEDLAGPADEPVRRLVAGAGDDVDVQQRLVARQRPGDAVLVLERRRQQLGHDVVGGMLGAPVDVLAEDVRQLRARTPLRSLREAHGLARLGAQVAVDVLAHRAPVLRRDAHEHPDDLHRHLGAEVGDEVEPVGADQRVEALGGEVADLLFERETPASA